jgi:hypothetical protein
MNDGINGKLLWVGDDRVMYDSENQILIIGNDTVLYEQPT